MPPRLPEPARMPEPVELRWGSRFGRAVAGMAAVVGLGGLALLLLRSEPLADLAMERARTVPPGGGTVATADRPHAAPAAAVAKPEAWAEATMPAPDAMAGAADRAAGEPGSLTLELAALAAIAGMETEAEAPESSGDSVPAAGPTAAEGDRPRKAAPPATRPWPSRRCHPGHRRQPSAPRPCRPAFRPGRRMRHPTPRQPCLGMPLPARPPPRRNPPPKPSRRISWPRQRLPRCRRPKPPARWPRRGYRNPPPQPCRRTGRSKQRPRCRTAKPLAR
ncbi:hypothetical protein ACFQU2_22120 [Siccirubricoccus deserti]